MILTLSHPVLLALYQFVVKVIIIIMTCIVRHCLWEQLFLESERHNLHLSDVEISPDGEVEAVTEVMTTGFVSPTVTAVQSPSKMNKSTIKYTVKIISHYCDGVRVINWDNQCCKFTDVSDLRSRLWSDFENIIHRTLFSLGTFN